MFGLQNRKLGGKIKILPDIRVFLKNRHMSSIILMYIWVDGNMKNNTVTLFSMDYEGRPFGYPMSRILKGCIISEYLIGLFCSKCRVEGLSRFLKKCVVMKCVIIG